MDTKIGKIKCQKVTRLCKNKDKISVEHKNILSVNIRVFVTNAV